MIAYEILVQTIAGAKAGVRPSAPTLPPIPTGAPVAVEEYSSGLVDLDEEQVAEAEGYEAAEYGEAEGYEEAPAYAEGQFDDDDED